MSEIALYVTEGAAEKLGEALMDAGALSVTIEDADADTPDEQPLYGEPGLEPEHTAWANSILKILVDDDQKNERLALVQSVATVLKESLRLLGVKAPDEM